MPYMVMSHETDPKKNLLEEIGSVNDLEIFNNQILCAVYIRPEKTKSGIYLTDKAREEDKFQGKVGLIVKMGPEAFADGSGEWFSNNTFSVNDWVLFRPSDGWSITVNGVLCRILDDINVRGRVQHPDQVW
jgi:co-chaperonin GroES (HSP10)